MVVNLFCMRAIVILSRALAGRTNTTSDRLTLCLKITHFVLGIQRYILQICTEPRYILLISNFSFMSAETPFFLPTIFLALSIVMLFKFFHKRPRLLRAVVTSENIFSAIVELSKLRREPTSSVILNLVSIL